MIALTLFARCCTALRQARRALGAGQVRTDLRASSALWRVMAGGSAGV